MAAHAPAGVRVRPLDSGDWPEIARVDRAPSARNGSLFSSFSGDARWLRESGFAIAGPELG